MYVYYQGKACQGQRSDRSIYPSISSGYIRAGIYGATIYAGLCTGGIYGAYIRGRYREGRVPLPLTSRRYRGSRWDYPSGADISYIWQSYASSLQTTSLVEVSGGLASNATTNGTAGLKVVGFHPEAPGSPPGYSSPQAMRGRPGHSAMSSLCVAYTNRI